MQTQRNNFRYRGWRLSRQLVELTKSIPSDLAQISQDDYTNQGSFDTLETHTDTLCETLVSELQHLRYQLRYRLRRRA